MSSAVVLGICLYGFLTDEPYWRENGHSPYLYNYLLWGGLALNGPSGFIADHLSDLISRGTYDNGQHFLIEYGFWLLLLWPQWRGYDLVAEWAIGHRWRENVLYAAISSITMIGCVRTYKDQIRYLHPDGTFLAFRIAAIVLAGVVVFAYVQFRRRAGATISSSA